MPSNYPHGIQTPYIIGGGGGVIAPRDVGNVYYVDQTAGSDAHDGRSPAKALLTLSAAHAKMTADQNDIVYVFGNTADIAVRESATLTWSKDCCHIIGLNALNPISQRVSIRSDGTEFSPLVNVTADGCVFANFHVFHGYDDASAQIAWQESGQRNAHFNLHLGGMGHATAGDQSQSRSLLLTGDGERYFKDCTVGLDTIARSTTNAELELKSSAARDIFDDCLFLAFADNAGHLFIKADDSAAAIDRFTLFRRCVFLNAIHSTGTPMTEAIAAHGSLAGTILLKDCTLVGATDWENSASGQVMIDGAAPTAGTSGLAVDVS